MIKKFSKSLVDILIKNNAIDSNLMEVYVYGYEVMISAISDLLITIIIGAIAGRLINAIIFFMIFVTVRVYTGGYHANTYIKCKFVFISIMICVLSCYSPPMLSTNRHRILSIRYWLCQPIGILFCQRNEMLLRKTKAINPITNLAHKQIAASSGFESG